MNQPSDNYMAETLIKDLGRDFGERRQHVGGAGRGALDVARFGISPTVVDGSGLSRSDRTSPRQVVELLTRMDGTDRGGASTPRWPWSAATARVQPHARHRGAGPLPHQDRHAARRLRAGRLLHHAGGDRIAFAFLMNSVYPLSRARLQDRMTVALARYTADTKPGNRVSSADAMRLRSSPSPSRLLLAAAAQARDATITSFDGTQIVLSFFPAEACSGQKAPTILEGHGWGGSRDTDPNSEEATRRPASVGVGCAAQGRLQRPDLGLARLRQQRRHPSPSMGRRPRARRLGR
jgi:hypothetical protein